MQPKISKYKEYSVQDFILDVDFIAWCKQLPEAKASLWLTVLESYPEKSQTIMNARQFLLSATVKNQLLTVEQKQKIWERIEHKLVLTKPQPIVHRLKWLWMAAAVLLLVIGGAIAYYVSSAKKEILTQYAEIKQIELPDHSKVTVNANSSIHYAKQWDAGKPREVWLDGEAYFDVNHLHKGRGAVQPGERFIVHANGVDIEVLGTSFNVSNRHNEAKITLTSGSIELTFADKQLQNVMMKPGDFVRYAKGAKGVEKKMENPEKESSWKEHQWTFDNSSLKDVLQVLKDNYGLEAKVEDPELWNKTISGTISSANTDIVLKGLSVLLDINIEQKNQTLILKH